MPGIMPESTDNSRGGPVNSQDVLADVLDRLRDICLGLPEKHEEQAPRWRIRMRTLAHVLGITDEYPPDYSRDAPFVGDATVVIFRSSGQNCTRSTTGATPATSPR
jgi:hypothetical protein